MNGQRTSEIAGAKRSRLVAKAQGVPPSFLTFSSRRVMESQIGTSYNLPCLLETLPDAQTESGVFYETPGWSEPGGGDGSDVTFPTIDTTGATADSTLSTADQTI